MSRDSPASPAHSQLWNEVRALSHSVTVHGETLTRTIASDLHALSPFPTGLGKRHPGPPLTRATSWKGERPARDRQGQLVSGKGSCAPLVSSQPVPSSPSSSSPQDPRPGLAARDGILRVPPPPPPQPKGGGSRPVQAWGRRPLPSAIGPTLRVLFAISQRSPAAPRAWGRPAQVRVRERCMVGERGEGIRGREGKEMGGPEPQSLRCLAPQCSLPPPHQTPTSLPSLEGPISTLSVSTLPLSLLEDWVSREDSRKPRAAGGGGTLKEDL